MKTFFVAALATALLTGTALADTIKVGVIGPFSGPFALQGKNFQAGIQAYQALNGDSVGDHKVEIVYRDVPQADPAQTRRTTIKMMQVSHAHSNGLNAQLAEFVRKTGI
ncbi:MAG: ABC transporter substrate-binding protein [Devosia nanyangense]|nr:ABC transporter substrate-binding protein [Devosia nanyangense]